MNNPKTTGEKLLAKDLVYDYVHTGIMTGSLRPGQFLEEKVISEAVGVSRTPVREAFHMLQNHQLISLLPRHGAQVRPITGQELMEVYEARRLIEGHAVDRICSENIIIPEVLNHICAQICETSETGDFLLRAKLDQAFHQSFVGLTRNATLTELYASLQVRQQRVAVAAMKANPQRAEKIDREHKALLTALGNHDAVAARVIIDEHLRPFPDVLQNLPL